MSISIIMFIVICLFMFINNNSFIINTIIA